MGSIARAHLQLSGSQYPDRASSRARVGPLRRPSCEVSRKPESSFSRHSATSRRPQWRPCAHRRRTTPALLERGVPTTPAGLVAFAGHAMAFHGFLNHPFPRHGSKSRSMRRSRPGRCLHPHEPVRSSHTGCIRCADASPVAGSRRNRRTRMRRRSFAVTRSGSLRAA
jgi:hypothetical protein